MSIKLKHLQHIYDSEIRKQCESKRIKIHKCFDDNKFELDNTTCEDFIKTFNNCINKFNDNFSQKFFKN